MPEGDDWLCGLPWVPNKSLTPITLDVSASFSLKQLYAAAPSDVDDIPYILGC